MFSRPSLPSKRVRDPVESTSGPYSSARDRTLGQRILSGHDSPGTRIAFNSSQDMGDSEQRRKNRRVDGSIGSLQFVAAHEYDGFGSRSSGQRPSSRDVKGKGRTLDLVSSTLDERRVDYDAEITFVDLPPMLPTLLTPEPAPPAIPFGDEPDTEEDVPLPPRSLQHRLPSLELQSDSNEIDAVNALLVSTVARDVPGDQQTGERCKGGDDSGFFDLEDSEEDAPLRWPPERAFTPVPETQYEQLPPAPTPSSPDFYSGGGITQYSPAAPSSPTVAPARVVTSSPLSSLPSSPISPIAAAPSNRMPTRSSSRSVAPSLPPSPSRVPVPAPIAVPIFEAIALAWAGQHISPVKPLPPRQSKMTDFFANQEGPDDLIEDSQALPGIHLSLLAAFQHAVKMNKRAAATMGTVLEAENGVEDEVEDADSMGCVPDSQQAALPPLDRDLEFLTSHKKRRTSATLAGTLPPASILPSTTSRTTTVESPPTFRVPSSVPRIASGRALPSSSARRASQDEELAEPESEGWQETCVGERGTVRPWDEDFVLTESLLE